ncbi:TetR/AcrR family transcriptional regulator [Ureibacillus acetophenoni]|uniref:TetR family transcriptional regulator n=1 Tax=Ureibacillus acetophenoni TaxID=614649 RepID=A0A285UHS4_9BACL|nr:helix-turn-helix domain-containing protein [Ureibacillus acetophenoni]SOC41430.1 TetR family transcriptional regulator [Ureibacillus acetophenoni]
MDLSNKTGLREKNRNKRYQSIVNTAEGLFANFGLENVKMQAIADEEGIGIATLFRYFPKKDKLIVAVATSIMDEELFQFQRIADEPINAYEKFSKIFDYLEESVTQPSINSSRFIDAFENYVATSAQSLEDIELYDEVREEIYVLMLSIMQEGELDGSIRKDINIKETLITFINSFGLFSRKLALMKLVNYYDLEVSPKRQLEIMKELYLSHIKA